MSAKKRLRPDPLIPRDRLLNEFQMLTIESLADFLAVEVKTLQNRDDSGLPPYSKVGGKRLFFKDDVMAWLRRNVKRRR